jgi:hypothetical protein
MQNRVNCGKFSPDFGPESALERQSDRSGPQRIREEDHTASHFLLVFSSVLIEVPEPSKEGAGWAIQYDGAMKAHLTLTLAVGKYLPSSPLAVLAAGRGAASSGRLLL